MFDCPKTNRRHAPTRTFQILEFHISTFSLCMIRNSSLEASTLLYPCNLQPQTHSFFAFSAFFSFFYLSFFPLSPPPGQPCFAWCSVRSLPAVLQTAFQFEEAHGVKANVKPTLASTLLRMKTDPLCKVIGPLPNRLQAKAFEPPADKKIFHKFFNRVKAFCELSLLVLLAILLLSFIFIHSLSEV